MRFFLLLLAPLLASCGAVAQLERPLLPIVEWHSSGDRVECSGHDDIVYDVRPASCEWSCGIYQGELRHVLVVFSVTPDASAFDQGSVWINESCLQ